MAGEGKCKGCGAAIAWVVTPSGQRMPVDAVPHLTLVTDAGVVVRGRPSHFASCPNADQFRRPR